MIVRSYSRLTISIFQQGAEKILVQNDNGLNGGGFIPRTKQPCRVQRKPRAEPQTARKERPGSDVLSREAKRGINLDLPLAPDIFPKIRYLLQHIESIRNISISSKKSFTIDRRKK